MRSTHWLATLVLGSAVIAGCQEQGDDGVSVDAAGTVTGLAWIDRNGNGLLDASDGPARDIRVELRPWASYKVAYTAETGAGGDFTLDRVLVGDYVAAVDSGTVGDSLRILRIDSVRLTVSAGDTTTVVVGLTYPEVTIDSARSTALESRVFIQGLVLSEWNTFGDAAVHIRDTTGAIRVVRAQPSSVAAGDSVRVLGVTSLQAGRTVLKDGVVFLLETGVESPGPELITTGRAASADGGRFDAELVRVDNAVVQDTSRNTLGEPVLAVDDGSGTVEIVLDRDIFFFLAVTGGGDVIGSRADATGVLVPPASGAAGVWVLKPRQNADLTLRAP